MQQADLQNGVFDPLNLHKQELNLKKPQATSSLSTRINNYFKLSQVKKAGNKTAQFADQKDKVQITLDGSTYQAAASYSLWKGPAKSQSSKQVREKPVKVDQTGATTDNFTITHYDGPS